MTDAPLARLPDRIRAAAYVRVSKDDQASADRASIPTQLSEFARYCAERAYEPLERTYIDVMSGARDDRPEWQAMLADARAGRFERIVALDPTRFGRDDEMAVYRLLQLKIEHGVQVEFVRGRHRSLSDVVEDFEDGRKERDRLRTRVTGALIDLRRDRGRILGSAPYGYTKSGGVLLVLEPEAAIVREVFGLYLSGIGTTAIARALNERGLSGQRGAQWSGTTIADMLRNSTYAGRSQWRSTDYSGTRLQGTIPCPAIVSEADYAQAVGILGRRAEILAPRSIGTPYLLSGVIYCGLCGARLKGWSAGRWRRYRCADMGTTSCRPTWSAPAADVEAEVMGWLAGITEDTLRVERDARADAQQAEAAVEVARRAVTRAATRLGRNNDRLDDGAISDAAWRLEHARIEQALAEATMGLERAQSEFARHLARADQADAVVDRARSLPDVVRDGGIVEGKTLLQSIIRRVVVYGGDGAIEVELV